ncbi:MAG: FUSC family protein [Sulfuricurvum sp.]
MIAFNLETPDWRTFPWRQVAKDWVTLDAPVLIYMVKTTIAAVMALWISMKLNLPDSRTAVFSTFIVMQPQSGMVFSKSYYRVLGTVAGVGISLLITGMFSQAPIWYIGAFALWIGMATAAGFKYRNFQSYGFVLAGYTLCIVALPVIETPLDAFEIAISRFSEVIVGIMSATIVSDVIFPRRLLDSLIAGEQERFRDIVSTLSKPRAIFDPADAADVSAGRFASGAVGLNAVRINSTFESGADRKERQHYQQLNQEYMNLSTTYHSLRNVIASMRERRRIDLIDRLYETYEPISQVLERFTGYVATPETLGIMNEWLLEEKESLAGRLEAMRPDGENDLEELLAAGHLMMRMVNELHTHCVTYASLLRHRESGKTSQELSRSIRFTTHTDNVLVALAALRGSGVLLLTIAFWIWTAWPFATVTITMAVVIGLLLGTLPSPLDGVKNFFKGSVLALLFAAAYDFYIIPSYTSDFLTLALVLSPVFAFVGWMTMRPKLGLFAFGFVFMFMTQCALDPYYKIEPTKFLESALASLTGIAFGGLAYLLVNFWSCSLTQKRVSKILRRQIVELCEGPLNVERTALESTGRDLVQQFSTQGRLNMRSSKMVFDWLLSTLEIGRSILVIRKSLVRLHEEYHPALAHMLLPTIVDYFEAPSLERREKMLTVFRDCYDEFDKLSCPAEKAQHRRQRALRTEIALVRTVVMNSKNFPLLTEDICR